MKKTSPSIRRADYGRIREHLWGEKGDLIGSGEKGVLWGERGDLIGGGEKEVLWGEKRDLKGSGEKGVLWGEKGDLIGSGEKGVLWGEKGNLIGTGEKGVWWGKKGVLWGRKGVWRHFLYTLYSWFPPLHCSSSHHSNVFISWQNVYTMLQNKIFQAFPILFDCVSLKIWPGHSKGG